MRQPGQVANQDKTLIFGVVFFLWAVLAGCTKSSNEDSSSTESGAPDQARVAQATSSVADLPPAVDPTQMPRILDSTPDNDFFSKGTIPDFRIEAGEDALRQLEREPRTFVHVDVMAEEVRYRDVGMHLKGRRGSFRSLESKPGLTLKFNEFNKGQRFHGLEKIHLNNSVQDASFMTEIICSGMFREAGVPAARATNARVTLNGRRLGFYVLVEGITKDFLRLYFEDPRGNLYDFPYTHDITSSAVKESKDRDHSDLRSLADAANVRDLSKRWQRMGQVLDLDRFISYLAFEVLIWDWDCYAMCRNNYHVYHDPTSDKLIFMPHGMDQIFDNPKGSILPVMKGLVARSLLETPEGRRLYFARMKLLSEKIFTKERMDQQVAELQERIGPVLTALNPNAASRHDRAVVRLQQRIHQRLESVRQQLGRPPLDPVTSSHFP